MVVPEAGEVEVALLLLKSHDSGGTLLQSQQLALARLDHRPLLDLLAVLLRLRRLANR
jgi:hypothetical protein